MVVLHVDVDLTVSISLDYNELLY